MTQHQIAPVGGRMTPARQGAPSEPATGILAGTIILTQRGEKPVEALRPGDRIITRDAGFVALRNIHSTEARVRTIRILAGSLGDTRPEDDLDLPANQKILIRDWRAPALFGRPQALAEVAALIDGEFIADRGHSNQQLYHLAFDDSHIIYAGGIEVEIDTPSHPDLRDAA